MRTFHWILFLAILSLAGCGDGGKPAGGGEPAAETKAPPSDHGDKTDLGTLTVAGNKFNIARRGKLVPGKEGSFNVRPQGTSSDDLTKWNLYLWVEDKEGTQLSAPSKGTIEGSALHFHVTPRASENPPVRVVLRLRADGIDERAGLPLDRSRPLWEMWVIEGLGGSAAEDGGDVVLMIKVHHAAVDGVSAANLLDKLCDIEPNAATPEPVDGPGAVPAWAIAAGAPATLIQQRLGHASVSTTLNVYAHLLPGLDEQLADRLDETVADAVAPQVLPRITSVANSLVVAVRCQGAGGVPRPPGIEC